MKAKKVVTIAIITLILIVTIVILNFIKKTEKEDNKFNILTSFYPIFALTSHITEGAKDVTVSNMAEHLGGCIHDYTMTTTDLKKFEQADIFIQTSRELESFTDKIIELYPNVKIIESGKNISNLIQEDDEVNPHIWLSIQNYISQLETITDELIRLNPENSEVYKTNSDNYKTSLVNLQEEFNSINNLSENKVICLNEALEYLLKEVNFEVTSIETDHEQTSLSAENLKTIIEKMKNENIKTIFIDKNDSRKNAELLANETGANIYTLDSGMDDDYLKVMRKNLEVIKNDTF